MSKIIDLNFYTKKGRKYRFVNTHYFNKVLNKYHKIGRVSYTTSDRVVHYAEGFINFFTDLQMFEEKDVVYIPLKYGTKGWVFLVEGVFYTDTDKVYNAIQDNTFFLTFIPERKYTTTQVVNWECIICH